MGDDKDASHSKHKKEKHKDRDRDREKPRRDSKGERDERHDVRRESQKVCRFPSPTCLHFSSCLHVPCQPRIAAAEPVLHGSGVMLGYELSILIFGHLMVAVVDTMAAPEGDHTLILVSPLQDEDHPDRLRAKLERKERDERCDSPRDS